MYQLILDEFYDIFNNINYENLNKLYFQIFIITVITIILFKIIHINNNNIKTKDKIYKRDVQPSQDILRDPVLSKKFEKEMIQDIEDIRKQSNKFTRKINANTFKKLEKIKQDEVYFNKLDEYVKENIRPINLAVPEKVSELFNALNYRVAAEFGTTTKSKGDINTIYKKL